VRIAAVESGGRCIVDFGDCTAEEMVERVGKVPLPPYIRHGKEEQAIVARIRPFTPVSGSIAAPTAGLHFTPKSSPTFMLGARFVPSHCTWPGHIRSAAWRARRSRDGRRDGMRRAALVREIEETRRGGEG